MSTAWCDRIVRGAPRTEVDASPERLARAARHLSGAGGVLVGGQRVGHPSSCGSSRGPWASRVTRGGTGGENPVTARSAVRMSSGRRPVWSAVATTRSIAHPSWSTPGADAHRQHRPARVEGARARLEGAGRLGDVAREVARDGIRDVRRVSAADHDLPLAALEPVGERPGRGLHHLDDVEPVRQGLVQGGAHRLGVHPLGPPGSRSTRPRWRCRWGRRWRRRSAGAGWKPPENAIGTSARRRARSSARAKSRVEEKRSRPRFA